MAELGRYRSKKEKQFYLKRKEILNDLDSQFIADNPFLFSHRIIVSDMLARIMLFKEILNISGSIVECGVANGNSLMLYAYMSEILEPFAINRKIIGFDSFEGFRSISSENDPKNISKQDFSDAQETVIKNAIELYDMNRPLGHMERIEIIKGDAVTTIPEYVKHHPELTCSLLYLDFDIYKPTKVALEHLLPLVAKGGIVAFDEFNYDKFSGETLAAKEVLNINERKLKRFEFSPFIAYFEV